jgi:hypothetical protein
MKVHAEDRKVEQRREPQRKAKPFAALCENLCGSLREPAFLSSPKSFRVAPDRFLGMTNEFSEEVC